MTCVAALVEKGKIYMGADSAGVAGLTMRVRSDSKVFKVESDPPMLMGVCGSFRVRDLLRYAFDPPAINTDDLTAYMVREFVEAVRHLVHNAGVAAKEDNVEDMPAEFIVGFRGRLFTIESDYQVGEQPEKYVAVGCGTDIAMGAFYATEGSRLAPKERVVRALKASARYSGGVCAPFSVLTL